MAAYKASQSDPKVVPSLEDHLDAINSDFETLLDRADVSPEAKGGLLTLVAVYLNGKLLLPDDKRKEIESNLGYKRIESWALNMPQYILVSQCSGLGKSGGAGAGQKRSATVAPDEKGAAA